MQIDEYAAWAIRTARDDGDRPQNGDAALAYLGLGLAGEAGKVVEHIKKRLRSGTWDAGALAEELGDLAYYWARLCNALGWEPSGVLARSVVKIEAKAGTAIATRAKADP